MFKKVKCYRWIFIYFFSSLSFLSPTQPRSRLYFYLFIYLFILSFSLFFLLLPATQPAIFFFFLSSLFFLPPRHAASHFFFSPLFSFSHSAPYWPIHTPFFPLFFPPNTSSCLIPGVAGNGSDHRGSPYSVEPRDPTRTIKKKKLCTEIRQTMKT
jgi:hypothetical protein